MFRSLGVWKFRSLDNSFCGSHSAAGLSSKLQNSYTPKLQKLLWVCILLIVSPFYLFTFSPLHAQPEPHSREYTQEQPLVYVGVSDLWPYAFSNDNGDPDGFNIDLVKLLLKQLNIPYVITMKSRQESYENLRDGKADLMMGLAVGFHDEYGHYGRNAITLFVQGAVSPKRKPAPIKRFRDMSSHQVIVSQASLAYQLMKDYGWEENAVPWDDMKEAVLELSKTEQGVIVWNELSLKWLLRKYQIDNLELTPVDMPHGEYKFMSNDLQLLEKLDSIYTVLDAAGKIQPLRSKWFYPETLESKIPDWVWYIAGAVGIIILLLLYYYLNYRIQERHLHRQTLMRNQRLALILETSEVRLWTYDLSTKVFAWRNENGQVAYHYTPEEFAHRYHPGDFERLMAAIDQLAQSPAPVGDKEEKEIHLDIKARDSEDGDAEERDFAIVLSVLHRNSKGQAITILGTKRDITEHRRQQQQEHEREQRYWAIFDMPTVGLTFFNHNGILTNINQKACDILQCHREEILMEHVTFHNLFGLDPSLTIEQVDRLAFSNFVDFDSLPQEQRKVKAIHRKGRLLQEVTLGAAYDDDGQLLGLFGSLNDISQRVASLDEQAHVIENTRKANNEVKEYVNHVNTTLLAAKVRMASYSPQSHTLTVFDGINHIQRTLTQARCMTLIDDSAKKKVMRLLNSMDNGMDITVDTDIRTTLRIRGGDILHLQFHLIPTRDSQGNITEYFGLCRDITEVKVLEQKLKLQTARAQEVDNAKNSFLRNMSYEIRTPLNAVVGFAELFEANHSPEEEQVFVNEILDNSGMLLHLIDDILFLSRIDARMVEIDRNPCDFSTIFENECRTGWKHHAHEGVSFIIENPYEQLVVDIDCTNLGHVIRRAVSNAAQFTFRGTVRARYDYIGRKLRISIDDTGQGIPKERLSSIYERFHTTSSEGLGGLGLPICKELTERMGGQFEISSEEGLGTTVWITIPCHATEVRRKKIV